MSRVVIIGAGHGGVQVADSLRSLGFDGGIDLLSDDGHFPYQRPPLSKDLTSTSDTTLHLRGARFFSDNHIDLRLAARVVAVDAARHTVRLRDGSHLRYDALVLATGSESRQISVPGADLNCVHRLRTFDDARKVQDDLTSASSAVVVGAGFIGLEFAAAVALRGLAVTVLEHAERVLARSLTPSMSSHVERVHGDLGVDLRFRQGVTEFVGQGERVRRAVTTEGADIAADFVLVGIGAVPRVHLAADAGLEVEDGIVVDQYLRTSDPAIFAVGDCARFDAGNGRRLRLESVQNATDQARHVAATLTGHERPYRAQPWFWSSQGPLRLQIAGLSTPTSTTVEAGDVRSGRFSSFCFDAGELVAVESANRPADHAAARRLLQSGAATLSPDLVATPGFDLKTYVERRRVETPERSTL